MTAEQKELYIMHGEMCIDLYDGTDMIPFEMLELFFKESLNKKV
jgi:hypothetical protein